MRPQLVAAVFLYQLYGGHYEEVSESDLYACDDFADFIRLPSCSGRVKLY
jgi:hypothetical protein